MKRIIFLIPIFNDWESLIKLLKEIVTEIGRLNQETKELSRQASKTGEEDVEMAKENIVEEEESGYEDQAV